MLVQGKTIEQLRKGPLLTTAGPGRSGLASVEYLIRPCPTQDTPAAVTSTARFAHKGCRAHISFYFFSSFRLRASTSSMALSYFVIAT